MVALGDYYKFTRSLDPRTGNLTMVNQRWKAGSPAAEIVLRVLKTPKGTYLPDPTFGFDYSLLDHVRPDSEEKIKAGIRECLNYLVKDRVITDLNIKVEVDAKKKTVLFDVSFIDPLLKQRKSVRDFF